MYVYGNLNPFHLSIFITSLSLGLEKGTDHRRIIPRSRDEMNNYANEFKIGLAYLEKQKFYRISLCGLQCKF